MKTNRQLCGNSLLLGESLRIRLIVLVLGGVREEEGLLVFFGGSSLDGPCYLTSN